MVLADRSVPREHKVPSWRCFQISEEEVAVADPFRQCRLNVEPAVRKSSSAGRRGREGGGGPRVVRVTHERAATELDFQMNK